MPLHWSTRSTDPLPARRPPVGAFLKPLAQRLAQVPRRGLGVLLAPLVRRQVAAGAPTVPLHELTPREQAAWQDQWRRERHARLAQNRRRRRWRPWRTAGRWLLRMFVALLAVLCAALGSYASAVLALSTLVVLSMEGGFLGAAARREERLLRLYRALTAILALLGVWTVGRLLWHWLVSR